MLMRTLKLSVLLVVGSLLAACSSNEPVAEQTEAAPVTDNSAASSTIGQADQGGVSRGNPLDDPESLLFTKIVYFEYDRAEVRPEDRAIVEAHGSYLAANPGATVTLEGHADERGSREYNIALGERRANSVLQLMTLLGAGDAQIRTVSYGEEQPAMEGHDEEAWFQNRRVEIVYRSAQ